MNWSLFRRCPWIDTRASFVAGAPFNGNLLDLGSSEGETLRHMAELRPDLKFYAADLAGAPEAYPPNCQFHRANLEKDSLPWPDNSMDAITCMHLVEHLRDLTRLFREVARLLKPGGRAYFETPHPKTVGLPSTRGGPFAFTLNFYDDSTHVELVEVARIAQLAEGEGLKPAASGISRNWLFAAAYPVYFLLPPSRKKLTARIHWIGWSAYLVVLKTARTH
jgi:SAM-dependent methyltransferase